MKKIALTILTLSFIICVSAQTPQAMNYQAIARNSLGQIVPSQNIGVRFTITDATGNTVYYQETQSTTTNNFGLFTLAIGKGTAVSGAIAPIDWSTGGDKYLKVEIAPQGGSNYTIQGTTQLISVPYALYSEKTKLIGGNAITITNGNTINANYIAGPGINITGNTISSSAWLLNGNAGTTASNFLGTTDNQPINFRTNNISRLSIGESTIIGSNNVSYIVAGQASNFNTNPVSLAIYGKDISGAFLPFGVATNIAGMTWDPTSGSTHTLGRQVRWSQWPDNTNFVFYDQGIDQEGDFFITEQGQSGTGGVFPKKMLQISATDNVGINMAWAENPTANFHTKGTLRFEGIAANNALSRVLVMDANGNVASRDVATFGGFWVADANGIHNNNTGHVGIGDLSNNLQELTVSMLENTIDGRSTARFISNDSWQTAVSIDNTTSNKAFSLVTGGTSNIQATYGAGANNFGIVNGTVTASPNTIPFIITSDDKVGISSSLGGTNNLPHSRLHVRDGDIYINDIGSGVIMKSPNGQCWRMTVSDAGTPVFTAIPCP
ncbi:MAG: hypothetical protein Q8941_15305 [Bacteroidota bacterium]|nr:hypothetical protein [Bacteroidota bacterium]